MFISGLPVMHSLVRPVACVPAKHGVSVSNTTSKTATQTNTSLTKSVMSKVAKDNVKGDKVTKYKRTKREKSERQDNQRTDRKYLTPSQPRWSISAELKSSDQLVT